MIALSQNPLHWLGQGDGRSLVDGANDCAKALWSSQSPEWTLLRQLRSAFCQPQRLSANFSGKEPW